MTDLFGNEHPLSAERGTVRALNLIDAAAERFALESGRPVSQERAEIVAPEIDEKHDKDDSKMSAYMVDDAHVDALIDIAKQYERPGFPHRHGRFYWVPYGENQGHHLDNETEVGRMLLAENARSVSYRYHGEVRDPAALTYVYRPTKHEYTPAQALMAIRGYEYQACETDDWDRSEAHAFCRALYRRIVDIAIPQSEADQPFWTVTDHFLGREVA